MMNKYTLIITGAGCLLAAAPADQQGKKIQEHRRFKRLSLPLR